MKKLLLLILPIVLLAFGTAQDNPGIAFLSTYKDGHNEAKRSNRLMFIVIGDDECNKCTRFKNEVLTDPDVISYMGREFVPVYLNPSERANGYRLSNWGVTSVPAILFMSANRKFKRVYTGYQSKDELLKEAQEARSLYFKN